MKSREVVYRIENYDTISEEDKKDLYLKVNEDIPKVHIDLSIDYVRTVIINVYKKNAEWNDNLV